MVKLSGSCVNVKINLPLVLYAQL